jgi:hypothetical protein
MLKNSDGTPEYEFGYGFAFLTDGDTYTNAQAEHHDLYWSGVFIDEISVMKQVVGEEVWSDTMVIPGPIEPCTYITDQFEWEDVPFSNYRICVETECDEACCNDYNDKMCADITVIDPLEKATPKEVEGVDYTGEGEGEWGICSSDTDNYLATNPDGNPYPNNANSIVQLCPDHVNCDEDCILDVSHLTTVDLYMQIWHDLDDTYDFVYLEVAPAPALVETDWSAIAAFTGFQDWTWVNIPFAPPANEIELRLRLVSDGASHPSWATFRGMMISNMQIIDFFDITQPTDPIPVYQDFFDTMDDMDNWCTDIMHYGNFWDTSTEPFCLDTGGAALPIDNALIYATEIADAYYATFSYTTTYDFGTYGRGYVEISGDGGSTWYLLDKFDGVAGSGTFTHDITFLAGNDILIRFRAVGGHGGSVSPIVWCVEDLVISGKKDTTPPTASITMSGTMKESGWYSTSVKVKITAEDEGAGVKEIHYILDGTEYVVAGDEAEFTINGNGIHNIEYWAVDNVGNEGPHQTVPTFRIDSGAAPTVAITAPEPGIYILGKKLLSSSNVFIIGSFTIEANAQDADSGIYKVSFYLDDELLGEDTEAPFSQYVAVKHMGAGTIKVVAEDFAQNVAEDTLDLKYYKFF